MESIGSTVTNLKATNADDKGSGFDRGHQAAAANHKWSQKAMEDTFYLSNVALQNPHLKQKTWNNLEKLCRSLTKRYLNVYVCSGPLYLPRREANGKLSVRYQVIRRNHVAVPTHFFKLHSNDSIACAVIFAALVMHHLSEVLVLLYHNTIHGPPPPEDGAPRHILKKKKKCSSGHQRMSSRDAAAECGDDGAGNVSSTI